MVKRYKVTLRKAEREQLTEMTRKGKPSAKKYVHGRVLLLCDAGEHGDPWKVADVAAALGVTTRTVEHIKERFAEEGMEAAIERRPEKGPRAATFDGAFAARLTKLACSQPPEGRVRWTLSLLAEKLVDLEIVGGVSAMTVQRTLKKTGFALT